jgi:hypothetical protein
MSLYTAAKWWVMVIATLLAVMIVGLGLTALIILYLPLRVLGARLPFMEDFFLPSPCPVCGSRDRTLHNWGDDWCSICHGCGRVSHTVRLE